MIPQVLTVRVQGGRLRRLRLWVPLLPVWLLLTPLVLLVLPVFVVACLVGRVRPFTALAVAWRVLCSLTGTHVEVDHGRASVSVRIA
jgi:hypothetical protein